MKKPNRHDVAAIAAELKQTVIRPECLTCDCFQGLLTQLELDCDEPTEDILGPLKVAKEQMHGCLGCDPCPGGAHFAEYLRSRTKES